MLKSEQLKSDKLKSDKLKSGKRKSGKRKELSPDEIPAKKTRDSAKSANLEMDIAAQKDQEPEVLHPGLVKRKVIFSGLKSALAVALVEELGGCQTTDAAECSVMVTDKMRKSFKQLRVISRGKPIVSIKWLMESKAAGGFLDPWDFIFSDPAVEKEWGCRLEVTLRQAAKKKIFTGPPAYQLHVATLLLLSFSLLHPFPNPVLQVSGSM